jgi:hypothetical protein
MEGTHTYAIKLHRKERDEMNTQDDDYFRFREV